jgi:hypothetical protein
MPFLQVILALSSKSYIHILGIIWNHVLMAHTYNLSYLGRLRAGGSQFKASEGKQFTRPHL